MARILIVGAGDIGGHLAQALVKDAHQVWGLRRSNQSIGEGVEMIQADVSDPETLANLPEQLDIVVYSVASPEFSKEGYHTYLYNGLRNVLKAVRPMSPKRVFFLSSSSVYHQMGAEWVDEESDTTPNSFAGQELLLAEKALKRDRTPGTVVRLTGVYGPGRLRMIEQARQGGYCDPEPPVWTNRIHRDDCVGLLKYMIEQTLAGEELADTYLATDNEPSPLYDILEWMKDRIGDVEPDKDMPEATRRANRRCSNQRIKDLGYQLQYTNYRDGYDKLLTDIGLI